MTATDIYPELIEEMTRLRRGDHLCLIYEDDPSEQMPALLPFIRQALADGDQFVYIADDHTVDDLRAALAAGGIEVAAAEGCGALCLWTRDEWRQPGELDSYKKVAQVQKFIQAGLEAGFRGVSFAVEMTWTLGPDIDVAKLRHWEAVINTVFTPDTPGRIVCQYSRKRLAPEIIRAGLSTHQTAILGLEVCTNPYYEAPLFISDSASASEEVPESAQVDWMLSRLRLRRALEKEREQRIRAEAALEATEHSKRRIEELYEETLAARAEVEEHAELLATVNRISHIPLAEFDLGEAVQELTDAATRIIGAQIGAFFYNVTDKDSASYPLHALSGVYSPQFEPLPLLPMNMEPAFLDEGIVRLDDMQQDRQPGKRNPFYSMPPGRLPVHSYLAVPVIARSGEVLGGLFFGHEQAAVFTEQDERVMEGVADQMAIAIENARLYEEAQHSVELSDRFVGIVSHELKTPLTVLKGYALLLARQLKRDSLDPAQLPGIVDQLVVHSRRLDELVNDLLDTSRIRTGRLELHLESLDLVTLAATVIERLIHSPKHTLLLDARDPVVGMWDPGRLDQVLTNLVTNAIKYSPDGGEICVSIREINNQVQVDVRDQGIGIAPPEQSAIFEPFRRLRNDTGGTGLGLYISSHLVALHGGTITVASTPGEGSTFSVHLPLYTPAHANPREV